MKEKDSKIMRIVASIVFSITMFWWKISMRLIKHNKEKPMGIPYQRDPDNPCEFYEPNSRGRYNFDDCESDGHYLCKKCCHKEKEDEKC